MSRRPSYSARNDEDVVEVSWSNGLQSHRPSVGQNLGIPSTSVPLLYDTDEVATNYNDKDDLSSRLRDLRDFRLQRGRRTWERLLTGALAIALIWTLTSKDSSGRKMLEKAKLRAYAQKPELKSTTPLQSFRANLKDGHGYVTTFPYGGYTNQLVELFKLVHLGQRLDRTAILPELKAVHSEGGDVPLSTFFDVKAFAYYANVTLVEWKNVKIPDVPGVQKEQLSCWGWRDERPLARYSVHTDFWPPPGQLTVPSSIETSMTFPAIEVLVSQPQDGWLVDTAKRYFGSVENAPPFPDKQLLCFDNLFYVPSTHFVEGTVDRTYSIEEFAPDDPVWLKVGQHLHFSQHINDIADELLYALTGSSSRQFIGIHIRQGDFVTLGRTSAGVIDSYVEGEQLMQLRLAERRKARRPSILNNLRGDVMKRKLPVVFATDSDDPLFIKKLKERGWIYIDHKAFATQTRFGGWYPGVLDSLILSRGIGFVGTKMSTFSYIAARRVEFWNGGVTTIVG
ncbi:hypothetical protein T439DRAFT_322506 [Meredithblackwellia eburnea MCA 4105]